MNLSNKLLVDNLRIFFIKAEEKGFIKSRKELKVMDTIDYSKMITDKDLKSSAMPSVSLTDKEKEEVDKCWYLILPPFKKGVIKPNRHRYIVYEILEINEEDHSYIVEMQDYGYDSSVWGMFSHVIGYFKWDISINDEVGKSGYHCQYSSQGFDISDMVVREYKKILGDLDKDHCFYMENVLIPSLKDCKNDNDFDALLLHFALISIRTNIQLLDGKPKAIRGSGVKIKTKAGEIDKNPKPKIVRALSGGIQIKSEKIPKPVSSDTIRKYSLEAWKTRGHIRRYKNGKTVWVKESVHHRKCLQTEEKSIIPQTIIKVG